MSTHEQYRDDLPLLAAGALPATDAEDLRRHVASCAECTIELNALLKAVSQVGLAQGGTRPPMYLREKIMEQIAHSGRNEKQRIWPLWAWVPVAAAVILAVATLNFWNETQRLNEANRSLQSQLRESESAWRESSALLATLNSPDALHVTLTAAGKAAPPQAKTIYSAQQHALVLTANNLPALPPHRAYQLWLLTAKGEKVPYGTFKPDIRGNAVLVMTALQPRNPSGFAVTVENESGSSAPTTAPILLGSL